MSQQASCKLPPPPRMPAGFSQEAGEETPTAKQRTATPVPSVDPRIALGPIMRSWAACVAAVSSIHGVSQDALTRREGHSSAKLTRARRLLCHGWVELAGDKALAVLWLQAFTSLTRGSILNILVRNQDYPAAEDLELLDNAQSTMHAQLDPAALPSSIAVTIPERKKTQAGLPRRSGPKIPAAGRSRGRYQGT